MTELTEPTERTELTNDPQYVVVAGGRGAAAVLALAEVDLAEVEIAEAEVPELIVGELDSASTDPAGAELEAPDADAVSEPAELPGDEPGENGRPNHLRVAPDAKRGLLHRRRRAQLIVLGVAAISAASMFLLVTFHVFAAQAAFSLDKLDNQLTRQQHEYAMLRDQVATLSSPAAVASGAQRLGLVRAPQVTQLHPAAAASFASTSGLPVPPPTPYGAIGDTGQ